MDKVKVHKSSLKRQMVVNSGKLNSVQDGCRNFVSGWSRGLHSSGKCRIRSYLALMFIFHVFLCLPIYGYCLCDFSYLSGKFFY